MPTPQADVISLARPDDFHVHFRQVDMLSAVVPQTARVFGRALVMPNTAPPIRTGVDADAYRTEIRNALAPHSTFEPLMTIKLTSATTPDDIAAASAAGVI